MTRFQATDNGYIEKEERKDDEKSVRVRIGRVALRKKKKRKKKIENKSGRKRNERERESDDSVVTGEKGESRGVGYYHLNRRYRFHSPTCPSYRPSTRVYKFIQAGWRFN